MRKCWTVYCYIPAIFSSILNLFNARVLVNSNFIFLEDFCVRWQRRWWRDLSRQTWSLESWALSISFPSFWCHHRKAYRLYKRTSLCQNTVQCKGFDMLLLCFSSISTGWQIMKQKLSSTSSDSHRNVRKRYECCWTITRSCRRQTRLSAPFLINHGMPSLIQTWAHSSTIGFLL